MNRIDGFMGLYRFLSNFWPAEVEMDGASYPDVEHAYQAAKTTNQTEREAIRKTKTPGEARRLGKLVTKRPDWDSIKLTVMESLVRQKFSRHANLHAMLMTTGNAELIETNDWQDRFWGVCRGHGENHLGKILMKIREELRNF